jgi:hypothetical protein
MENRLHDIIADTFDKAGPVGSVIGNVYCVEKFDLADFNPFGQLKASNC